MYRQNSRTPLAAVLVVLSIMLLLPATTAVAQAQAANLTIVTTDSGNIHQGDTGVTFTITVSNSGAGPSNGTVVVSDKMPLGLTATAISGTGWGCTLETPYAQLGCARSDSLAPGASFPPITVTADVDLRAPVCSLAEDLLPFQAGDIFLTMADGTVQWRHRDWTLARLFTSVTDGQAKGMTFDAAGNLLMTHWLGTGPTGNGVVRFDKNGNLIGLLGNGFDCNPSSIVMDRTGNFFVGQADCSAKVVKLDPAGNPLAQFSVAAENRGSAHILLDADPCTLFYTSEGANVKRFNVCTNSQMANFNTAPLPDSGGAHQFVRLPDGGMLVANMGVIARLSSGGNLLRTFTASAGDRCWLGVALDPDGATFWASNWCDSSVARFDFISGAVVESHVADDRHFMVKQIAVPPSICATTLNNVATVTLMTSGPPASSPPVTHPTPVAPPVSPPLPPGAVCGRFTGGGSIFVNGSRITHGFELHCNASQGPNNLEINFGGSQFHLTSLTTAACTFNPSVGSPAPPPAPFNTITGSGTGNLRINGTATTANISFVITDAGEPGRNDTFGFTITSSSGAVVFAAPPTPLTFGNQQAHGCN